MSPNNTRPPLTENLDRCAFHPDRPSVGWRDVMGEDGAVGATVGACAECAPSPASAPLDDIEHVTCRACGQSVVVRFDGLIGKHNMPGWTEGSRKRADRGEVIRPDKCLGSLTRPTPPTSEAPHA